MRIITWNCNGAFRKKFEFLKEYNADIIVVQECEDPSQCNDFKYQMWAKNCIWKGDNKNKGLGIFCSEQIDIQENSWQDNGEKYFISAKINDEFDLVAVWAHGANSPAYKYIGQFWKYLQLNKGRMSNSIILGDFNSNKIWDKVERHWNHSDVVNELKEIGIVSAYHEYHCEIQGEERTPTFFLQKNISKPYHIDYIFTNNQIVDRTKQFEIGSPNEWIGISDHMPLLIEISDV